MSAPAGPTALVKPLYTARATATGGRAGHAVTDDGLLDVHLSRRADGRPRRGHQPRAAVRRRVRGLLPERARRGRRREGVDTEDSLVEADVSIGTIGGGGYGLAVALKVSIPGVDADTTLRLAEAAHQVCPYSNATRGNIEVTVEAS